MNRYEIEKQLDSLYLKLDAAKENGEPTVCIDNKVDSRDEAITFLEDEIEYYERELSEIEAYESRTLNYQRTADMPFLCW